MNRLSVLIGASITVLSSAPVWSGTITAYGDRGSFNAAVGPTYLDTFDDLSFGPVPENILDREGATYSAIAKEGQYTRLDVSARGFGDGSSDLNDKTLIGRNADSFINETAFVIDFDGPVQGFAFDAFKSRSIQITIQFIDGSTYTADLDYDRDFNSLAFYGFSSSENDIVSVFLRGRTGYNAEISNFAFSIEDADVPEPEAIGLLGIGFLAAAVARRRRRR